MVACGAGASCFVAYVYGALDLYASTGGVGCCDASFACDVYSY